MQFVTLLKHFPLLLLYIIIFLMWYERLFFQVFSKIIINDIQIEYFIKKNRNCLNELLERDSGRSVRAVKTW